MIRVLIAESQTLVRAGLVTLFRGAPGFAVGAEAADGESAVELAARTRPDVALMDVDLPVVDGIEAATRILSSRPARPPRVVMLAAASHDAEVYRSLAAGVAGFLLRDVTPERLLAEVAAVHAGEAVFAPAVTRDLVRAYVERHRFHHGRVAGVEDLTARETEVLRLVAGGLSNATIAGHLGLSEATVKTHLKRVMAKLGLSTRAEAVVQAYESGLVVPRRLPD